MPMKTLLLVTAFITLVCCSTSQLIAQSVHWKKMNDPIEQTPNSIQKFGNYLFMTTKQFGVHRSSDGGETWEETYVAKGPMAKSGCFEITDSNGVLTVACNVIRTLGDSYMSAAMYSSIDTGRTWDYKKSLSSRNGDYSVKTMLHYDNGYIIHYRECYSKYTYGNKGFVHITDGDSTIVFSDEKIQHLFRTKNNILYLSDTGIYLSHSSEFSPQIKQRFLNVGDSTSYCTMDENIYVCCGENLYISANSGETWKMVRMPQKARYIQVDSSSLIMCDMFGGIWISKHKGMTWYKRLGAIIDPTDYVTCFYADDEQIIYGLYRRGVRRYSLCSDQILPSSIKITPSVRCGLKITDRGICYSPVLNTSEYFSGFCNTIDLGKTWKYYEFTPWGPNDASVHSSLKYKNGCFSYFSTTYHSNFEFCFNNDRVNGGLYGKWHLYDVEIGDITVNISESLGWINLYKNSVIVDSFRIYLPEFPKKKDYEGLPYLKFHAMGDTLVYRILDTVPNMIYYSTDFGRNWNLYNDWRLAYGDSGVPIPFGNKIIRKNKRKGYQVLNRNAGYWYDMYESGWNNLSIYDYDYNDSIFVVCNDKGIFYITPDDLSEITSVEEIHHDPIDFTIKSDVISDFISIDLGDIRTHYSIRVISLIGQEVVTLDNVTNRTFEVDCTNLSKGMYFVEVTAVGKRCLKKVLKM